MKVSFERYGLFLVDGARVWHFPLTEGVPLTIGRSSECDLVVKHPCMSRRHAVLHLADRIVLEDLGGANGTFVGGRRLLPQRIAVVELGEPLSLGTLAGSIVEHRASGVPLPPSCFASRPRAGTSSPRGVTRTGARPS